MNQQQRLDVQQAKQDMKTLQRDIAVYGNMEAENKLRNEQRDMIYTALKKRDRNFLEDFQQRAVAYDWSQGYQRTPIDGNAAQWKRRDPILKALDADAQRRKQQGFRYGGLFRPKEQKLNSKPKLLSIKF